MYIAKYIHTRKLACLQLDNLYTMPESFTCPTFKGWTTIIDIENIENYLKFDGKGILCMEVCMGIWFHFIMLVRWDESLKSSMCQETNSTML
jgi:hypothetical protein